MFYVYWDTELVAAVSMIDELKSEIIEELGSDIFEFIYILGKNGRADKIVHVQMADGAKYNINLQVFYADHVPYGFKELPF